MNMPTSSSFKQWDPGEKILDLAIRFYNLEDKVVLEGRVMIGS